MSRIQDLRTEFEDEIMRIEGVVGVGTHYDDDGTEKLRVLTSVPPDRVTPSLPEAVRPHAHVVWVGAIEAQ